MNKIITQLAGWLPAIILPAATFIQLFKIIQKKTAKGISITTWTLFLFANLGLYIYTEKFFEIQSILSLLLTAVLDLFIIIVILYFKKS